MAAIAWLDFSSAQRDRVLDALAEPKDKGTLDELGYGTVRDAIADRLFPAVSTIQTRAKYLLFVPWILTGLADGTTSAANLKNAGESKERRLIHALLRGAGPGAEGLIGKESKDALKRFPSAIYWGSMRQLKIFQGESSLAEYLREIDLHRGAKRRRQVSMYGEEVERPDRAPQIWDAGLPDPEPGFLDSSTFELTAAQAAYLREKFLQLPPVPGELGLIQWLAQEAEEGAFASAEMPWDLLDTYGVAMPHRLRRDLEHARNFSLCIQGCVTLYYFFLSRERDEPRDDNLEALEAWCQALGARASLLVGWHDRIGEFWHWVKQVKPDLSRDMPFLSAWLKHLADHRFKLSAKALTTSHSLFQAIRDRELRMKVGLARFNNKAALERWQPVASAQLLTYRWPQARRLLMDIHGGISSSEAQHA